MYITITYKQFIVFCSHLGDSATAMILWQRPTKRSVIVFRSRLGHDAMRYFFLLVIFLL